MIPYNAGGDLTYEAGHTAVFTNLEPTGCPITECLLMNADCSTTPPVDSNFWITPGGTGGTPWALTAKRDVEVGWSAVVICYRCKGTAQTGFQQDNLVGHSVRGAMNCATHMPAATSQPVNQILDYTEVSGSTTTVFQITDFVS